MKILSFISFGQKGATFESTLFDFPLRKFCKENNHEHVNIDIEHLNKKIELEQNPLTLQQRTAKHVFQQVTKMDPDVIFLPFGDEDRRNVVLPPTKGAVYVVTREHDKLTPDMLNGYTNVILMNNRQRRALGRGVRLFPPLNEHIFFPDPDYVTSDERLLTDVSFFGRFTPKRLQFLKHLIENKINVKAYGEGWFEAGFTEETTVHGIKVMHRRNATFERQILTRTKIGLVMADTIKPIHFEVPACGAMLVSDSGRPFFRAEEELLTPFKTKDELLTLVRQFVDNPQLRIEMAGKQKEHVLKKYRSGVFFKKSFNRGVKDTWIKTNNGEA